MLSCIVKSRSCLGSTRRGACPSRFRKEHPFEAKLSAEKISNSFRHFPKRGSVTELRGLSFRGFENYQNVQVPHEHPPRSRVWPMMDVFVIRARSLGGKRNEKRRRSRCL